MLMRMAVTVATGQGEQAVIDIPSWNPVTGAEQQNFDDMAGLLDKAFAAVDLRVKEMNTRMIEAYQLTELLPSQEQFRLQELLDVLAGRVSAATLRHRWQSVKEENEALANGRMQAQQESLQNQKHTVLTEKEEQEYYERVRKEGKCTCSQFTSNVPCPEHM